MKLTSHMIKEKAREIGLDVVGIADIGRFKEAPALMNPMNLFPEAKSIVVTAMRIPRGTYRGIEEGTHWHNYTYYSYNKLNTLYRPRLTYALACFIEDHGWEAMPHFPGVPERNPLRAPVAEGKVLSDVNLNIRLIGVGAGIGEMGHSKVFLNPKFGPRVRMGCILTDAVLEPDPVIEPGTICNKCGRCVRECPGYAIPSIKEKDKLLTVHIGEKKISWADVDMGRCTLTHHGFNNTVSPFLKKDLPNMEFDTTVSNMTEEEAYRLTYPMSSATWLPTVYSGEDNAVMQYYHYIRKHTDYFAICGARGCIRACMDNLEKNKKIENCFHQPFYRKKSWLLDNKIDEKKGKINPWREAWLDENYPGMRDGEQ